MTTNQTDLRAAAEFLMAHLGDPEDAQPCACFADPSGLRDAMERVRYALTAPPRPDHAGGVDPNPAIDASEGTPLTVDYVNYRGERGTRHILPGRIVYGATEYHPRHQWLLEAFDLDKGAMRVFAMEDMQFLKPSAMTPAQAPDKAAEREGLLIGVLEEARGCIAYAVSPVRRENILSRIDATLRAALAPKPTGTEADRGVGRPLTIAEQVSAFGSALATPTPPTPDSTAQGDGTSQEGAR